jgi:hypothetical protein
MFVQMWKQAKVSLLASRLLEKVAENKFHLAIYEPVRENG